MLTLKKGQTVKTIKPVKVGNDMIPVGEIFIIEKGGKNPEFIRPNKHGDMTGFGMNGEHAKNCLEDVVIESKIEKNLANITFKKHRSHTTFDGVCFSADICIDNKKVAEISDEGMGGETALFITNDKHLQIFENAKKELCAVAGKDNDKTSAESIFASLLFYYDGKLQFFQSFTEHCKIEAEWERLNGL